MRTFGHKLPKCSDLSRIFESSLFFLEKIKNGMETVNSVIGEINNRNNLSNIQIFEQSKCSEKLV